LLISRNTIEQNGCRTKVTLKVDAYPDYEFEGTVVSFSPATGSRFSILPPDNATGNFVKTIQRLPVKISID
jgi:membrane fusion protein (multidrug efflux system)